MKEIFKLGLALTIFATAACVALAFVYDATSRTIEARQAAATQASLASLLPEADNFENIESIASGAAGISIGKFYKATKNGALVGAAAEAAGAGFSDAITVLTAVGLDGKITGIRILAQTETPGLGAQAASPSYFVDREKGITFFGQFAGRKADGSLKTSKDGGDVEAITAATITSRAVTNIVNAAAKELSAFVAGQAESSAPSSSFDSLTTDCYADIDWRSAPSSAVGSN